MVKIDKIKLGIIAIILIVVVAILYVTYNEYFITDIKSDDSIDDDKQTDVEPNDMDNFYLQGIVVVENEVPNLTLAVISENIGEKNLSINGRWNLTQANNSQILDTGEDNFNFPANYNITNIIYPKTNYIGPVIFRYGVNDKYISKMFNTTMPANITEEENETEEPQEENETSDDDGSSGGGGGGGGYEPEPPGCYYDFKEYDPNGSITLTEDRITFTELHRNYSGSVYKDFGSGYFGQSFTHKFQFKVTSSNDILEATFMPWSVCNNISTYHDFRYGVDCDENTTNDNHDGLALTIQPKEEDETSNITSNITSPHGLIRDWTNGTYGHFEIPSEDFFGKMIYVTISRDPNWLVVILYRDSARTQESEIVSARARTGPESYDMVQAFGARGSKKCEWWGFEFFVSGLLEKLDLGK